MKEGRTIYYRKGQRSCCCPRSRIKEEDKQGYTLNYNKSSYHPSEEDQGSKGWSTTRSRVYARGPRTTDLIHGTGI